MLVCLLAKRYIFAATATVSVFMKTLLQFVMLGECSAATQVDLFPSAGRAALASLPPPPEPAPGPGNFGSALL